MAGNFGNDIRIIARTRELEEKINYAIKLALAANREPILGERIITQVVQGAIAGVQKGAPGETKFNPVNKPAGEKTPVPSDGDPIIPKTDWNPLGTDKTDSMTLIDPDPVSGGGGGSGVGDDGRPPGTYNAADLLNTDPFDPPVSESAPDGTGGGVGGAERISRIVAQNATTDTPLVMDTNGGYRNSPGWEDPDTPPVDNSYRAGQYFYIYGGFAAFLEVPYNAIGHNANQAATMGSTALPPGVKLRQAPEGYNPADHSGEENLANMGEVMGPQSPAEDSSYRIYGLHASGLVAVIWGPVGSSGHYWGYTTIEDARANGLEPEWLADSEPGDVNPSDIWNIAGYYILALINGIWTPNIHDSEVPTDHKKPMSTVNFKMGPDRYGMISPAKNGGMIMYETDGPPPANTPIGTAMYIRSDKTIGGFVPATDVYTYIPFGTHSPP